MRKSKKNLPSLPMGFPNEPITPHPVRDIPELQQIILDYVGDSFVENIVFPEQLNVTAKMVKAFKHVDSALVRVVNMELLLERNLMIKKAKQYQEQKEALSKRIADLVARQYFSIFKPKVLLFHLLIHTARDKENVKMILNHLIKNDDHFLKNHGLFLLCHFVIQAKRQNIEGLLEIVEAREPSLLLQLLTRKYQIRNCSGKIMECTAFQISLGEGDMDIVIPITKSTSTIMPMPTGGTTGGGWSTNVRSRVEITTSYRVCMGIAEILIRYLQKVPNGGTELLRQYQEQFPEGYQYYEQENLRADVIALCKTLNANNHERELNVWRDYLKTRSDERYQEDLEQLRIVLYEIYQSNTNEECETAIVAWQHYLDSQKDTMSHGFHSKIKLCLVVNIFLNTVPIWNNHADPRRYRECAVKVFGYLQRFFPTILAMLYTQTLDSTISSDYSRAFEMGAGIFNKNWPCDENSLLRSLENFVTGEPVIFPLDQDPKFQLGRDYYVRETCRGDVRVPYSQAEQCPPSERCLERYYKALIQSLKQIQQLLEKLAQEEQKQSKQKQFEAESDATHFHSSCGL